MEQNIFLHISILLGITVSAAFIVRLLRQPLMIAYITAGIVAGPLFLNLINHDNHFYEAFAEFGVVLLLFVVGLGLNFRYIKQVGRVAVIAGMGQVLFTGILGTMILRALNFGLSEAIYLAVAITFSSTIIIIKLLGDKKDLDSTYGRYTVGLMLVQDVVAIVIMILLTGSAESSVGSSLALLAFKGGVLVACVYFLSRFLLPILLKRISGSSEFLFIFTIAWCFGVASLVHWAGFSIELGAVMAGISLGSSPYQLEITSRIKPLRDFFLIIFFIILGSQMQLSGVESAWLPGLILSLFILLGNPFILYWIFRFLRFTRRNSFLSGVTAAQVSEFGFVLIFMGRQTGHVPDGVLPIFTLVALITIFVSSYIITYNEQIYRFLRPVFGIFGPDRYQQRETPVETHEAWIFGYHRLGWKLAEALASERQSFGIVDYNPGVVEKAQARGLSAYFGDAADVEFLSELPLNRARIVVSTLPAIDDQLTLIRHVRTHSKRTIIVASLYDAKFLDDLYAAGADYVMMPHLIGGTWVASLITGNSFNRRTFARLRKEQKSEMKLRHRHGVR